MDVMAAHKTCTHTPTLYKIFKEKITREDRYGHRTATYIYYAHIKGNRYYEKIYESFLEDELTHDTHSKMVSDLINKIGYKYFVQALDKVIKIEYGGKTENFPKGKSKI